MLFKIIADLLLVIHLLFIIFVIFGGFLAVRWRFLIFLHLPSALWGALIEFYGWICPLTPWEQELRHLGGQAGYSEGFIEHYLLPIIYPAALTSRIQTLLGLFVIAVNIAPYTFIVIRSVKKKKDAHKEEQGDKTSK